MNRPALVTILALGLGVLLLHAVLVMPSHPAGLTVARFVRPTWELPVVLLALSVLPRPRLRTLVVPLCVVLVVLRAADLGTYLAFSRPFNPLLDLHLLVSGWALLASSIGSFEAIGVITAVIVAVMALALLLWACLSRIPHARPTVRGIAVAVPLSALGLSLVVPGWTAFAASPVVAGQVVRMTRGVADLAAFTEALHTAPDNSPRFAALQDRDVILAFVESYGRTFLDDPEFQRISAPRLKQVEAQLADSGWHIRSAWAAAPTQGGQSWLSHGTLLSGLWVDSQIRYDRLMTSDRISLNGHFGNAGWRTGAAMPAIALDWPEAAWFDYDVMLDAEGLDYAGQPFEWVTMPDQYTWSALDRLLRKPGPDMIEVALITSHAPWTPLPVIVPWEDVGDGAIFDGSHRQGDSPKAVWSDPDRIREQYALSLDYALEVVGQYIARDGDGAVFIVLGDHQPAPLLTGQDAPPDVPVHFIADDPDLLTRLPDTFFAPGIFPDPDAPILPMQNMYSLITTAFEAPLPRTSQEN